MTPSEKLVLKTSCSGCNRFVSYNWTVTVTDGSQPPKLWPDYTMTSQTFPNLVLLPHALSGGKQYKLRLEAKKESGKNSTSL